MLPEQVPGTLFVLLLALGAWMVGDITGLRIVFLLALGCAAGWQTFNPNPFIKGIAFMWALGLWAIATVMLFVEVL